MRNLSIAVFCCSLASLALACPKGPGLPQVASRQEVYAKTPYREMEAARYQVKYFGILVGYGNLDVKPARKHQKQWVQVLQASGATGDWYSAIFVAKDRVEALSNPLTFAASHFFIDQDEGKMFGSRLQRQKWINFVHEGCMAGEKVEEKDKPTKEGSYEFGHGSLDVLSAAFWLRTHQYQVGKPVRIPVYTNEKTWELVAEPVAIETVTVPAGVFKAAKLKLTTYIGSELQQKGDVYVWIAQDRPERPMVKVMGEIKIGSVEMLLEEYKAGS